MGVAALLGGQLRGFTSLVWGLAGSVLMLATPIGSALPSGAVFAIVILVWLGGWIRLLGPWPWCLALMATQSVAHGLGNDLAALPPMLLGLAASLGSLGSDRLDLGSSGEAIWRFQVLAQALAEVDNGQQWALHPLLRDQVPPLAAAFAPIFDQGGDPPGDPPGVPRLGPPLPP